MTDQKEFDEWFKNYNTWNVSRDDLIHFSYVKGCEYDGEKPYDIVYTSPTTGSKMTRRVCSNWIDFYSAALAGWKAAVERDIEFVRARLIHAEQSGFTDMTANEILAQSKDELREKTPHFERWLNQVDKELESRYGMGHRDLEDFMWLDYFNDEYTPQQAVNEFQDSIYSPQF